MNRGAWQATVLRAVKNPSVVVILSLPEIVFIGHVPQIYSIQELFPYFPLSSFLIPLFSSSLFWFPWAAEVGISDVEGYDNQIIQ